VNTLNFVPAYNNNNDRLYTNADEGSGTRPAPRPERPSSSTPAIPSSSDTAQSEASLTLNPPATSLATAAM
jgi:hypothetical protein